MKKGEKKALEDLGWDFATREVVKIEKLIGLTVEQADLIARWFVRGFVVGFREGRKSNKSFKNEITHNDEYDPGASVN